MKRTFSLTGLATTFAAFGMASPAAAKDGEQPAAPQADDLESAIAGTVFDGDWIAVGMGVAYGPTYDGSDDYAPYAVPGVIGQIGGIGISPRPAGLALNLIPRAKEGPSFSFGPAVRLRTSRSGKVDDPVVDRLDRLDRALEVGPTVGMTFPKILSPYDQLSFGTDVRWDVLGAHGGMTVSPAVTYFTPLSRGAAAALSVSTEYGDGDFMEYYYSVTPAQTARSGLKQFDAGAGFTEIGVTLAGGLDLSGDLTDGGFSIVVAGGYSRMLGDAASSPFTSERGSKDQWLAAIGLGYVF